MTSPDGGNERGFQPELSHPFEVGRPLEGARKDHGGPGPSRLRVMPVKPAYQQVADELRAQIVGGVLAQGERLPTEPELCQMFKVSRSTVREALRLLASQHLIETTRGVQGGSFVASPDPARVVEDVGGALGLLVMTPRLSVGHLLEARLLFEPVAARLAAERADEGTIEAVQQAVRAPRDARDPSGFVPHIDFHTVILLATGNPMLAMMLQPVSDVLRTRLERARPHDKHLWDGVDAAHAVLADAIAARDAERAEQLMREHLEALWPLYHDTDKLRQDSADSPE